MFVMVFASLLFLSACRIQTIQEPIVSAPVQTEQPSGPSESAANHTEAFFEGEWGRTGVIRAGTAQLSVTGETRSGFSFSLTAYWGDHVGLLIGTAEKESPVEAVYLIEANELHEEGALRFLLEETAEPQITVSFEGDPNALDFGLNVVPDGAYIKGEPVYVSDSYPLLVFKTQELLSKVKELITSTNESGDDLAYENLLYVLREGIPEIVEPGRYKGFFGSGQMMGADLLVSEDGQIYLMAYGLDRRSYVFYTTDIAYHGWMTIPEFLDIDERIAGEVEFAYNGNLG
jgi:hypothetical protein